MPIPFLLVGAGILAGAIGVSGHSDAKATNERAQRISNDAKKMYDGAKSSLEQAKEGAENALLKLGYTKKDILEGSMKEFIDLWEKIKDCAPKKSEGLKEIENFNFDQEDILQIKEMTNIYESTIKGGAAGIATGALIALAASGTLPIVTGELALAGSCLVMGEIGTAVGVAASALSFGAAMTPLAAVVAPVIFFTGISASMKADENLEKAHAMHAEAEKAVEEMKVSQVLCEGISKRSEMFNKLLIELDGIFSKCLSQLSNSSKMRDMQEELQKNKKITSKMPEYKRKIYLKELQEKYKDELALVSIARSLAGAIKAIIDTPILTKEGRLAEDSSETYNNAVGELVQISQESTNLIADIDVHAMNLLGSRYKNGEGVEKDYAKAVECYSKAAEAGSAEGMCNLGVCYEYGTGVRKNKSKAAELYKKAAEAGSVEGICNLGVCYEYGTGVRKNKSKAVELYKKAAEAGSAEGICNLGTCYEYGTGIKQDIAKAVELYKKSAEIGSARGMCNLGYCYYRGEGVEWNYYNAVEWYRKSVEKGNARAMDLLGDCYYFGRGAEQNYFKAVELYKKSAEAGYASGMYDLGYCYYYGYGLHENESLAKKWLTKSAKMGNSDAKSKLEEWFNLSS